nr:F-box domain [Pandoravirus massiliensis]
MQVDAGGFEANEQRWRDGAETDSALDASHLPTEVWAHILGSVDPRWRFCARSVCRQWKALVERLPVPCDLDVPAGKRRLARGYRVCASAAALAYCHPTPKEGLDSAASRSAGVETGMATGRTNVSDDADDNDNGGDDENVNNAQRPTGPLGDARGNNERVRVHVAGRDIGWSRMLAVERVLALVGWTHDGHTKRPIDVLDIAIGLLRTGDEAGVDAALSWLEARPQEAAACVTPSDPCDAYTAVASALARHARIDWVRRAERAFRGFVARDHCTPTDALLSGDAAFASKINGAELSRWYAHGQLWEAAGRLGVADLIRDLVAEADAEVPIGTYQGLPPRLRQVHWHTWSCSGMHPSARARSGSTHETCAQVAARAAIAHGRVNVITALLERAGDVVGLANHGNQGMELSRLFDYASMAASREGMEWCLQEAARTSTFLDVIKGAAMAVAPIWLCTDAHATYRRYGPHGDGRTSDETKGKWYRGVRVIAWLRESGLGSILDTPGAIAAIIDHARTAKAQLALMLVYAPVLASMCARGPLGVHHGQPSQGDQGNRNGHGEASDHNKGNDRGDVAHAIEIVTGIARGACSEAFLNGKIEIMERLIAALDALARRPSLDRCLVAQIDLRACATENVGSHASCVLAYARHRAMGSGMGDAARQAIAASGGKLRAITPWTFEASKTGWRRWWRPCNGHADALADQASTSQIDAPEGGAFS